MNRLVIIGNGFDLAHGLKTSYKDFIEWYLQKKLEEIASREAGNKDVLLPVTGYTTSSYSKDEVINIVNHKTEMSLIDRLNELSENGYVTFHMSSLLKTILNNLETKGWVDIEFDYYTLLKENKGNSKECKNINEQMFALKTELAEYLNKLQKANSIQRIKDIIKRPIKREIAIEVEMEEGKEDVYVPSIFPFNIMLLNFNYTPTVNLYTEKPDSCENEDFVQLKIVTNSIDVNYIHGELSNKDSMIFGYSDERDEDFIKMIDDDKDNEISKNVKSIRYQGTNNYSDLMKFIEEEDFEVDVMGHSCGKSDRTLLRTIFEHEKCIKINVFYYKDKKNYFDVITNIYKVFKNKETFRNKVQSFENCEPLPQYNQTE